jgi:uncharacterized protein YukE
MSEQNNQESGSLRDEFRNLGNNLKGMVNAAWESDERKKFQAEIEDGMRELGVVLDDLAEEIRTGDVGQKIRHEVDDFSERVRSGEVESKAREEVLKALKTLNTELEKVSEKFSSTEDAEE